jgi:hypothetical protein
MVVFHIKANNNRTIREILNLEDSTFRPTSSINVNPEISRERPHEKSDSVSMVTDENIQFSPPSNILSWFHHDWFPYPRLRPDNGCIK